MRPNPYEPTSAPTGESESPTASLLTQLMPVLVSLACLALFVAVTLSNMTLGGGDYERALIEALLCLIPVVPLALYGLLRPFPPPGFRLVHLVPRLGYALMLLVSLWVAVESISRLQWN